MHDIIWAIGLVLLGLFFLLCEAFIPSAGILGVLAALSILGGMALAFYTSGMAIGTGFMTVTTGVVLAMIALLVRWWPKTPLGKRILNQPPTADEVVPDRSALQALVGQVGRTVALMLPGGMVEIEGKTYDAVTQRGSIEKGEWVEVVALQGRDLVVRLVDDEFVRKLREETSSEGEAPSSDFDDVVSDPFADPLP